MYVSTLPEILPEASFPSLGSLGLGQFQPFLRFYHHLSAAWAASPFTFSFQPFLRFYGSSPPYRPRAPVAPFQPFLRFYYSRAYHKIVRDILVSTLPEILLSICMPKPVWVNVMSFNPS